MQATDNQELVTYDVVVVGGGAAGLGGALMLGRSRRSVLVIDSGEPRNALAAGVHGFLTRDGMNPAALLEAGPRSAATACGCSTDASPRPSLSTAASP